MSGVYNPNKRYLVQGRVQIGQQIRSQDRGICDSSCNIPCEQVNLVVEMFPKIITYNDKNINISYISTNTTSQSISSPIILVSSLLGNIILTTTGLSPGQSISINKSYSISNMSFPSNTITDVSYIAYGNIIPGGYSPGDRLSKVITTTSTFQSSPSDGPTITSSGEIIDGGDGVYIMSMSFINTSNTNIIGLNVPLSGIVNISDGVSIIRNPNNLFQLNNTTGSLVLAPNQSLLPGVRNVVVLEGTLLTPNNYCDTQSCLITYTATSSSGTNPNLQMILGINTN